MNRLPAGKVYGLFMAGASVVELADMFRAHEHQVEAALRRQLRLIERRKR